ncbi:MAG: hypothetical protein JRI68_20710 [Deltaproteobacteria bacterium]|nr:hypothetical protein [Deltaproteobacteria bacterium]
MGPATLATFLGIVWSLSGTAATAVAPASEPTASACLIRYWTEARARYPGYDHLVHIHNGCELGVACTIHTSVRPSPLRTTVAARAKVAVLTYRGSPARRFNASVNCQASR